MRETVVLLVLLLVAIGAQIQLTGASWGDREKFRRSAEASYVLPSKFSRVLSFGNKGVLSDYQFLKVATFYGGRILHGQPLTAEDLNYLYVGLDVTTDLDPYFFDPYLLAEGVFPWDAGMIDEANRLLEKGMRYRTSDWRLPFFVGFNHFYFNQDFAQGGEYIMRAAKLPGSPAFLPNLGARLAYYGGNSKTAVLFLKGLLAEGADAALEKIISKRLLALERAVILEEAAASFRKDKSRDPQNVEELVMAGYLDKLPEEPYNGQWIFLENGRVFSTSRFAEKPPEPSEAK